MEKPWRSPPDCHACVFYAAPALLSRALPILERSVRNYRHVGEVHVHLWPCDVLSFPHLAHRAMECCEQASVAVIVAEGDDDVRSGLTRWFDHWDAPREGMEERLIVLFHPRSPDRPPPCEPFRFLIERATRSGAGLVWRQLPPAEVVAEKSIRESLAG